MIQQNTGMREGNIFLSVGQISPGSALCQVGVITF
jgi:hypothetical protein